MNNNRSKFIKKKKKYIWNAALTVLGIAALIFVTLPLFHDGFFPTMDDVQVVRIQLMHQEVQGGQFPVRYIQGLGNGAGFYLFNFYPPLAYYVGAIIHQVGFSLVQATKLTFLSGFLLAGSGALFLFRKYSSLPLSILATILLLTAPYYTYEVYTRGALAEFIAISLIPWSLYALTNILDKKNNTLWILIASLIFAAVFLAHSFIAYIMYAVSAGFVLLPTITNKSRLKIILSLVLGLGLSAFFWLPVIFEQNFTQYSESYLVKEAYMENFLSFGQLTGVLLTDATITLPTIGICISAIVLISAMFALKKMKETTAKKNTGIYLLIVVIVFTFLTVSASEIIWRHIPYLKFVQYPWRLYGPITLLTPVILVIFLSHMKKNILGAILVIGIVIQVSLYYPDYYRPESYNFINRYYPDDKCGFTLWGAELLSVWADECFPKNDKTREYLYSPYKSEDGGVIVTSFKEEKNGRKVTISKEGKSGDVSIRKYYFPGWSAKDENGRKITMKPGKPYGQIVVQFEEGHQTAMIEWNNTPVRLFANGVSVISGIIFLGGAGSLLRRNRKN